MKKLYLDRYGDAAEFIVEFKKNNRGMLPWVQSYNNARERCSNPNANKYSYYGGRGIKCLLKPIQFKEIFFRDKAYLMACPSVDRINPSKNYELANVKYSEFGENRKQKLFANPTRKIEYESLKNVIVDYAKNASWRDYELRAFLSKLRGEIQVIRR